MPRKSSKGKGGKKRGKVGKDLITGRSLALSIEGKELKFADDVVYEIRSNSPGTSLDDTWVPLRSIPFDLPPEGTSYGQFQLGDNIIVFNTVRDGGTSISRQFYAGQIMYDKGGRATLLNINDHGYLQDSKSLGLEGVIYSLENGYSTPPSSIPLLPKGNERARINSGTVVNPSGEVSTTSEEHGGGIDAFRDLASGKLFYDGWQNNLFDTSLV